MIGHNRKTRYGKHDKKGLLGDRGGAIAVWTALMMVSLLGITALALDMGYLWVLKSQLQTTADASALAGAARLTPPARTTDIPEYRSGRGDGERWDVSDVSILLGTFGRTKRE